MHKTLLSGIDMLVKFRGEMGQVQLLAVFLFLLLIPTTAIIAQNSTIQANFSGGITGETISAPVEKITEPVPDHQPQATNDTLIEKNQTQKTNTTQEPENTTSVMNETADVVPPSNQTNETTVDDQSNQTDMNQIVINETIINDTNQTQPPIPVVNVSINVTLNETINDTEIPYPVLDAGIISPDSITRDGMVEISAYANNVGTVPAYNVEIQWLLPDGFNISIGNGSVHCQEVAPETSCWNTITATVPLSSKVGLNDIGVRVRYNE